MRHLPPMVSMARTPKEIKKDPVSSPVFDSVPAYPWGLCISFDQETLDKLGLSPGEVQVGDTVHLFCFAKVTSISSSERQDEEGEAKSDSRIELQITDIASEDEDSEGDEADKGEPKVPVIKRLYGGK